MPAPPAEAYSERSVKQQGAPMLSSNEKWVPGEGKSEPCFKKCCGFSVGVRRGS